MTITEIIGIIYHVFMQKLINRYQLNAVNDDKCKRKEFTKHCTFWVTLFLSVVTQPLEEASI